MSTQNTRPAANSKSSQARRRFLKEMAGAAGGACMLALGVGLYGKEASARPAGAIRPPGALPEQDFLAACVRCGLCVRDCPFDTLRLSELGDNVATGTPFFEGRKVPCDMCDDIPCVKACPTGALDRELTDIGKARMGLAVLIDQETCLNFLGLRCDVCYRVCPVIDKAITLELVHNPRSDRHAMLLPTVHSEHCTGCGKCEHSCVLPEAAIKVLPHKLAQGKSAEHYRKGWVEREAAGGSLIGEQQQLPMRGLEDRKYGDTRVAPGYVPPSEAPVKPGGIDSGWKP